MKKLAIAATAVACLAGLTPGGVAEAGPGARKASLKYSNPNTFRLGLGPVTIYAIAAEEVLLFDTKRGEDHFSLRVRDDSGTDVAGTIFQSGQALGDFCRSTKNVHFKGGKPIRIVLWSGNCADGSTSIVTSGVIKATFADRL
ncbi:MAG: hypothetical protein M3285_04245 [Actinomycetota bacterium]|nr:hypothetical protein [Actinomycetota bacterium]